MAETSQEKTEQATPRQLERARERGEVARSQDLTAAAVLAMALGLIGWRSGEIAAAFRDMMRSAFTTATRADLTPGALVNSLGELTMRGIVVLLPLVAVLIALSLLIPFLQIGSVFTFEPLKPKLSKLNPLAGLKRMFFSLSTYVELLKAAAKVAVIVFIVWAVIQDELATILMLPTVPLDAMVKLGFGIVGRCVLYILLFYIAIAVVDLFYQRWQYQKNLRMTKQQVKEEYKEQEGDPHHKHARKRMHQEILDQKMIRAAEEAHVIVTNPTHLAAALRYDPAQEGAPRLVAKGEGWIAEEIRRIAKRKDIPIVRDVSLAHALNELEVDTEVPQELYDAVAELLKWVETLAISHGEVPPWLAEPEQDAGEEGV